MIHVSFMFACSEVFSDLREWLKEHLVKDSQGRPGGRLDHAMVLPRPGASIQPQLLSRAPRSSVRFAWKISWSLQSTAPPDMRPPNMDDIFRMPGC